jgi:hypothetical protein
VPKYALIVAVENYRNPKIPTVQFATADAANVATALRGLDFEIPEHAVLVDSHATKTTIESRLRTIVRGLHHDDTFFFFYAGHGFAQNGTNYITCYDTEIGDLSNTSVAMQQLFAEMRQSKSQRIAMFFDACESGLPLDLAARRVLTHLDNSEIEAFFQESEYYVCFASCKTDESSYSSPSLKHGIWTYHLLQALTGNAPDALERGRYLTSTSLQDYLASEVPRTVRTTFSMPKSQTPWYYGARSREFLLADLLPILEQQRATASIPLKLKRVVLSGYDVKMVRYLSGFNSRFHFVPSEVTPRTENFVATIAEQNLQGEADEVYQSIRKGLGYTRRDLKPTSNLGSRSIITPDFDFELTVRLNPDDPSRVIWRRVISNIRNPQILFEASFDAVFSECFDTLEFHSTSPIDVEALIDRIEMLDDEAITLDYPSDASSAEIRIAGMRDSIRVDPFSIVFHADFVKRPSELLQRFSEMRTALAAYTPVAGALAAVEDDSEHEAVRRIPARSGLSSGEKRHGPA